MDSGDGAAGEGNVMELCNCIGDLEYQNNESS